MKTFAKLTKHLLESLVIGKIVSEVQIIAETVMNLITPLLSSLTGV